MLFYDIRAIAKLKIVISIPSSPSSRVVVPNSQNAFLPNGKLKQSLAEACLGGLEVAKRVLARVGDVQEAMHKLALAGRR